LEEESGRAGLLAFVRVWTLEEESQSKSISNVILKKKYSSSKRKYSQNLTFANLY
jgi:hypothetical protein